MRLSDFVDIKRVAGGNYGQVYKAKDKECNIRALKKIDLTGHNDEEKNEVMKEAEILKTIENENIVKIFGSFFEKDQLNNNQFFIVMEFCPDNLTDFIDRHKNKNELIDKKEVLNITKSICKALLEIHNKKIMHRDLKPDNILLSQDNKVKISDFGVSKQLKTLNDYALSFKGTTYYMAPVLLQEKPKYNFKVDNWALGCIIYELCTLDFCFYLNDLNILASDSHSNFKNLLDAKYKKFNINFYGKFFLELIDSLLKKDYHERADIKTILEKINKYEIANNINQIKSDVPKINNEIIIHKFHNSPPPS